MKSAGFRACVLFVKYMPIVSALAVLLYVSALVANKATKANKIFVEKTFVLPTVPTVGTIIISKSLGFCKLHRYFIGYTYGVTNCMARQANTGFGEMLVPMRIVMLIIGVALFVWLFVYMHKHRLRVMRRT